MLGLSEALRAELKGTVFYNDIRQEIERDIREAVLKEGLEEGLKKGIKEGSKEGIKAGKLEAAPLLAKAGYSPKEIAKSLGLSINKVNAALKK